MSQLTSEKITALCRCGDAGQPRMLAAALIILCAATPAFSVASFDRADFSQIEFSDDCIKKQWALTPENTLSLQISPPPGGVCKATLYFHFPQDVRKLSVLRYEARSTRPGPFLKLGFKETGASAPVRAGSIKPGFEWGAESVRFHNINESWRPSQVAALEFMAISNKNVALEWADSLMIRDLRFDGPPPVPVLRPPESIPDKALAPSIEFTGNAAVDQDTVSRVAMNVAKVGIPIVGIAGFLFLIGQKGSRRRNLSPLYEINTRTWKSERDAHDVIQLGGFKKLTIGDLKSIKQAGFNAIWVMGIWEIGPKVRHLSKNYAADFQGSPFAISDYSVSADLGTEEEFRDLVLRAHSQRLSVIVDFVPNHMGLDSVWLNDHPEYFIHHVLNDSEANLPDDELQQRYPGYFPYRTPSYPQGDWRVPKTLMIAYGKDPYFYPWIDTAQLDHAHPGLRKRLIDVLCKWARIVDGVRCDMAMLLLRDQVKMHRHPEMSWETFNQMMPGEFWSEAIRAVKRVNPNFVFLAETYWSMEGTLQNLGFDYTYNKPLYEAICSAVHSGHAEGLMNFIGLLGTDFLKRSVHFLENHDEERAMNVLGEDRQRAAAAILCTLPGIALMHQGQMEGRRERLPVQRVVPLHQESDDASLFHFYRRLLKATALPVFQEGRIIPLYSNNAALACYARLDVDSKVMVIVNTSHKRQKGSVFLMPGLRLHSAVPYKLQDLFYEFKSNTAGTVQPFYLYPGAKLINQGLYVELEPFDAHIFLVEPQGVLQTTQKAVRAVRQIVDQWPVQRLARRLVGAAFTRSSDTNLAANPAGRQP